MELRRIKTPEDIEIVKSFFYKIFLDEYDYNLSHFRQSVTGKHPYKRLEYYIAYENNLAVGLSGVYANRTEECWLGWFGICPQYRGKGYATTLLDLQLQMMKDYGYKICRLYTNHINNKEAVNLYLKKGFKKEAAYSKNLIIMSKSLYEGVIFSKWKGKPLGFVKEYTVNSDTQNRQE